MSPTEIKYFAQGYAASGASLVAQMVKNLLAMQETWVWSLGWDDPLQKGMATYSSILAWRIPWPEEPGRLQSMGSQRVRHNWTTNTFTSCSLWAASQVFGLMLFDFRVHASVYLLTLLLHFSVFQIREDGGSVTLAAVEVMRVSWQGIYFEDIVGRTCG